MFNYLNKVFFNALEVITILSIVGVMVTAFYEKYKGYWKYYMRSLVACIGIFICYITAWYVFYQRGNYMVKYFQNLLDRLSDIVDSMTPENIKVPLLQYVLTLLQIAIVVGICFLLLYWGVSIVGDVTTLAARGMVA